MSIDGSNVQNYDNEMSDATKLATRGGGTERWEMRDEDEVVQEK